MMGRGRHSRFVLVIALIVLPGFSLAQFREIDYEGGIRRVRQYIRLRDFAQATAVLEAMLRRYPDNPELLHLLGKVLFWDKKYEQSIHYYERLLKVQPSETIRRELERVRRAMEIREAERLLREGRWREAEQRLLQIYRRPEGAYDAGYRLGMLYIRKRQYGKAVRLFRELKTLYPTDLGFQALYIEALILDGSIRKAKRAIEALPKVQRRRLYDTRRDLFYRVRRSHLEVRYQSYRYSGGRGIERILTVGLSHRVDPLTVVVRFSNDFRFGRNNQQIGVEIYSKLGERTKRWGYVAASYSPNRDFLPHWTLGGEIYQGLGKGIEFSMGYFHMAFRDSRVDILIPGLTLYFPAGFSLNERLYYVPARKTVLLLSTLHYEPHHKVRAFYSFAVGDSSERIGALEDIQKFPTVTHRLVLEYKLTPPLVVGAEVHSTRRKGLYDRRGWGVYLQYRW